jgi:phosphatidylserine/phosphatidylglycerophosphate/cardiolipin synthase-like enzyme
MASFNWVERLAIDRLSARSGLCAALMSAWARLPTRAQVDVYDLIRAAGLGVGDEIGTSEVFASLESMGLTSKVASRWIARPEFESALASLAIAFAAIDHFKKNVHRDATEARVVLTRPGHASVLESELIESGWQIGHVEPTDEAFVGLVRRAQKRVVIMTPFLDERGATWLQELIGQIDASVEIVLVLRSLEDPTRTDFPRGVAVARECLSARAVVVYNYSIPHNVGQQRETFHAKIILADSDVAYVGSANLTAASRDYSMEVGVVVKGKAARDISVLIEAVLRTSRQVKLW